LLFYGFQLFSGIVSRGFERGIERDRSAAVIHAGFIMVIISLNGSIGDKVVQQKGVFYILWIFLQVSHKKIGHFHCDGLALLFIDSKP